MDTIKIDDFFLREVSNLSSATKFLGFRMYFAVGLLWRTVVASLLIGWHFDTQAAATITFSQVGNDVQATISGSFDLTGLIAGTATTPNARVRGGGSGANVVIGPAGGASTKFYTTIIGPTYIGCSTGTIDASSGTANPSGMFGINMASPARLLVPQSYTSGANVSASATWDGATISSLGLKSGTYVYSWPGDSLTIIIPGPSGCIPTLSLTNSPQTYTGSPIAATVSCQGGGTVSNVLYGGSGTIPSNVGSYTVTANCAESSNYSAVTGASAGNFVISPATPTLSVSNTPQTYTGSPIAATVSCQGGGTVSNVLYGGSGTVPSNVGSYALTANCAASTNYSAVTGASAGNFVITAAPTSPTPFVPSPTMQTTVSAGGSMNLSTSGGNGNPVVTYTAVALPQAQAAARSVAPRTGGLVCTIVGSVLTPTGGTGVCQVTATQGAYGNYQAQTTTFNITVTAAPSPEPIPTLSEWGQIILMFLMIASVGFYGWRMKQH